MRKLQRIFCKRIFQGKPWWSYHLLYGALHRTAWAIAISWIIFACNNEYAHYLNRFLSFSLFVYLSKASYAVPFHYFIFILQQPNIY